MSFSLQFWIFCEQFAYSLICLLQGIRICVNIRKRKIQQSALPHTKKIPRSAQLHIPVRDLKSIIRFAENIQPFPDMLTVQGVQKNAVRLCAATSDPSAQLMQLCQSKPFRIFDHHYSSIRHIDPNLDDRRGDKYLNSPPGIRSIISFFSSGFIFPCKYSIVNAGGSSVRSTSVYSTTFSASIASLSSTIGQITYCDVPLRLPGG